MIRRHRIAHARTPCAGDRQREAVDVNAIKCAVLGIIGMLGVLVSTIGPLKVPFAATLYKTYKREAIVGLVVTTLVMVTLVTAVVKLFDPNQFKDPLVRWVHQRTQRDLVLDGELTLSYFPKLALQTGRVSLSQRRSAREFAALDGARLTFAWWPLLRRELRVDRIEVQGLRTQLVRFKDGSTNVDDLARDVAALLPTAVEIDGVKLTKATLQWNDEITWQRGSLHDLQLELGRVADGLAGPLTASARVGATLAGVDARLQLGGRVLYDAAAGRVELAHADGRLEGQAFGVDNLTLHLQGDVTGLWRERTISIANLAVTSLSKSGLSVYNTRLAMPELKLGEYRVTGQALAVEASVDHPDRRTTLSVQVPRLEWADQALRDTTAKARLTLRTASAQLRAQLDSPLRLTLDDGPRLELGAVELAASASHPALAGELAASASGRLDLRWREQLASAAWKGQLAGHDWQGEGTVSDFQRPRWQFDLQATRLDLDALLSRTWLAQWGDDAAAFDVTSLRDVSAKGRLRIGQLQFGGVTATAALAGLELDKSALAIEPITAQLHGAPLEAGARIEAGATPRLAVRGSVVDLPVRPLLEAMKAPPWLDGRASASWDVATTGASMSTLRQALIGTAQLAVQGGSVAGVDLRAALREGRHEVGQRVAVQAREFNHDASTSFTALKARLELRNGRALGPVIDLQGPAVRASGEGVLLFDNGALDLQLLASAGREAPELAALAGISVPVQVQGPWRQPRFAIDFAAASGGNLPRAPETAAAASPALGEPEPAVPAVERQAAALVR